MDEVRDKLIELFRAVAHKNCFGNIQELADYLIVNGVTVQQWIPASEPPEKAGWYQVHTSPEKGHKSINKAQYCKEPSWCVDAGKGSWHGSGGIWTNVTHWRPLPQAPGKDGA